MEFEVKAFKRSGSVVALTVVGADEADVRAQAQRMGYGVLAARRKDAWRPRLLPEDKFPLALFNQELLALLQAGLTVVEAVEGLAEKEQRPEGKRVLERVLTGLREGQPLSQAMRSAPACFPPLYLATVQASEHTGDLAEALGRYLAYQVQMDAVKHKVVSASIYPLLLLVAGFLVTLFLFAYVVPKFALIYRDLGGDLPWLSRLLLQTGEFVAAHTALALVTTVASTLLLAYGVAQPASREWVLAQLARIRPIGGRLHLYRLARFYRMVAMLLRGGVTVVTALNMVTGVLPAALRSDLQRARELIREGRPISQALTQCNLATPVAARLLRVGERSGNMGAMMDRIASFYDDDIARWVEWATRLVEPLLMAAIGLVIGVIIVLMYLPIFELAGGIQ